MRRLRYLAVAVFLASVPVFLVATNVRWVVNAPALYSYGFDKYEIPSRTGIERSELLLAAGQIREYFNDDHELLDVKVRFRDGVRRTLYNTREVEHMRDVKGLLKGVYLVQWLTGTYLLLFAVAGLVFAGRRSLPRLVRYAALGGAGTVGLLLATGLVSLVGFDRLFLAFHLVSFSNDLWQLDPRRDYLIAMFPEGFFFDATMWIAGSTAVEAVVLFLVGLALLRWLPGRTGRAVRASTSDAQVLGQA